MVNDQEVIQAVLSGDSEAFSALIRAYQARVRLTCIIRLGQAEEADDAAQAVFIKAFQNLVTFKGESKFETWLMRIAENHCLDMLRSRQRHKAESLDALAEAQGDAYELLLKHGKEGKEEETPYDPNDLQLLAKLFAALPEDDRHIISLREVQNLSYEEIADRLGVSMDAVKGRLKRARQALIEKCRRSNLLKP